jgi:hypothetical protein
MNGGKWHIVPDQEINANAIMRYRLEFDSGQDILEGALLYKIQRQQHTEADRPARGESKHIQLLVVWHVKYTEVLYVHTLLVEHGRKLDKDKLKRLYQKYWHLLDPWVSSTEIDWLLDDASILKTRVNVMNEGYRCDIFISEGTEDDIERPFWIDAKRCVANILVIFPMLTRTISLTLYKTMLMTIHNQYPNIKLASQIYFCSLAKRYEYLVNRTNDGTIMKIGFRFDLNQDEFGGILMYEVQRKGKSNQQPSTNTISSKAVEDTSKMMRLLVTWRIERSGELEVDIMLVEHDNKLVLDRDKLALLYNKINDWFFRYNIFHHTWLMCDNTALEAICDAVQKEGLELKITVSEGTKDVYTIEPIWIDSERYVSFLTI